MQGRVPLEENASFGGSTRLSRRRASMEFAPGRATLSALAALLFGLGPAPSVAGPDPTVDRRFLYVGIIPVRPTEGGVWPQPQHLNYSAGYRTMEEATFRFEATGAPCALVDAALERYRTVVFRPPRGRRSSPGPRRDRADALASVAVHLAGRCEDRPHLAMDEAYQLIVDDYGGVLRASSVWGILRGLETFSQLVHKDSYDRWIVWLAEIVDYPRFPHRGVLLDTARHFISKRILLRNLDALAYNKFNVFHWHVTDDQSFPYQSAKFPNLSGKGAYHPRTHVYTAADVAEIVEYGRQRGVRVVPEFGTPAHTFSWGHGAPHVVTRCYDASGGQVADWHGPLDPTLTTTYVFLRELFQEVMSLFPDDHLHLGGDEVTFHCWKSNPEVRAFVERRGFGDDYRRLLDYYFGGLMDAIRRTDVGRRFVVWQEVFDDGVRLPPDTVVQVWKDDWARELATITGRGLRALLSSRWYLSTVSSNSDWKRFYKVEPLAFSGSDEQKRLVIGGEACLWGEQVDGSNLLPRLWPRAAAVAERLWSAADVADPDAATDRLTEHTCRLQTRGIDAQPQNGPTFCEGDSFL